MNFLIISILVVAMTSGLPQSPSELASGTKYVEQQYYSIDAPNLIPFDNPTNIDNAKEESEGYGSKIDSVYDGLHRKTADVFKPQPVVDNLKENEKYGNTGDQLSGLSSVVVSVMSVVSNLVNKIVDAPVNVVTSVVQSANKVLNGIGAKIVGLQK